MTLFHPPKLDRKGRRFSVCPKCAALHGDGMVVDFEKLVVTWPGGEMKLSKTPMRVLQAMLDGHVTRYAIGQAVWGVKYDDMLERDRDDKNTSVQVFHLRRAMKDAKFPGRIENKWGVGYVLVLDAPAEVDGVGEMEVAG